MPHTRRHLTLLVPGLSGPCSDPPVSDYFHNRPQVLDRFCSRSRRQVDPASGLDMTLCRAFGIRHRQSLPVAALTWLADCATPPPPHLLRADPVHLRADQRYLRLFELHTAPLHADEVQQLVASLNAFIAERGWQLHAPDPCRWYLTLPAAPAMVTHAPQQVAGADIDPCLPAGADAILWHAAMNELQMLLHDHPVNLARAQRGEPVINSLWFWGNGILPDTLVAPVAEISATHPLARGLARHAGIRCIPLPDHLADWLHTDANMVVLDSLERAQCYNDIDGWLDRFEQLERDWLRPAALALRNGRLAAVTLDCCNGVRLTCTRWRQLAFWKPLQHFEDVCRP